MPYNPNNVPNSPLPISMLPAASTLKGTDLLLVTQVQSDTEKQSRQASLSQLMGSAPVGDGIEANIFNGKGGREIRTHVSPVKFRSMIDWGSSSQQRTELAELDLNRGVSGGVNLYGSTALFALSFQVIDRSANSRSLGRIIEPIAEVEITDPNDSPVSAPKLEWSLGQQVTHKDGQTTGTTTNFTPLNFSALIPIGGHAYNVPLKAHLYLKFSPSTLTEIAAQEFRIQGLVHSAGQIDHLVIK